MSGSYYARPYLPPESAPPVRLGPVLGAVLVAGFLSSGLSVFAVSFAQPSGLPALYLIGLVAWIVAGMVLLPPLLREFAGIRIGAETAFFVLLAGGLTTFALRFVIAQVFFGGAKRFAEPTPGRLGAALVLTWGASFVGAWVSANLARNHARPLGQRTRSGSAVGLGGLVVVGVGLMFVVAIAVTNRNISKVQSVAKGSTAGLSTLVYGEQVETTQSLVLDAYRVVTTSKPSTAAHLLRANTGALSARARWLAATSPPGEGSLRPHRAFVAGLQSFVATLPRIGALRTSRAQRRAFMRAPGLRTMYSSLTDLSLVLHRVGFDRAVFEPDQWSAMLHGRT